MKVWPGLKYALVDMRNLVAGMVGRETTVPIHDDLEALIDGSFYLGGGLLTDINRCADALERIAAAQEARLQIETMKAGLFKDAVAPQPSPIIRPPRPAGG